MEISSWDCEGFKRDVIEFDVDKDIILNGLRLFVSKYNLYNLRYITVIPSNPLYSEVLLEMKLESSTYPSGLLECQNFHRFEV